MNNIIKSALENYDKNQEKILKMLKDIYYLKFNTTERIKYITFYDKNKKKILESAYQLAGIYLENSTMWKWAWTLPGRNKDETDLSRKVLDYAFNLDNYNEIELRSQLINSTIPILNSMQMDINIAIISYITKIPFIFKIPLITIMNKQEDNLYEYSKFFTESTNRNNNIIVYMYILDFSL
jgi:hypothetical protein